MTCDLRGCADSAGVSDTFPTGESRTHNPLVLGSNPSGPTNQPVDAPAVRKIGATDCRSSTAQLKLFSQLFETEIASDEAKQPARQLINPRSTKAVARSTFPSSAIDFTR